MKQIIILILFFGLIGCDNNNSSENRVNYSLTRETIEPCGYNPDPVLVIDNNDIPYIFFEDRSSDYKYITKSENNWTDTDLDAQSIEGCWSALFDSQNYLHLVHNDNTTKENPDNLHYYTNKSGGWQEVVTGLDFSDKEAKSPSIDRDGSDNIHIAFADKLNNIIIYMTNKNGSWEAEEAVTDTSAKGHTSLKIDSNGFAHIAYIDLDERAARYVTNRNGSWELETLETDMVSGEDSMYDFNCDPITIDIDTNDNIHIVYFHSKNRTMYYVTNKTGSWAKSQPDKKSIDNGRYNDLKTDGNGFAHIAYSNQYNGSIKYCTNRNGAWQVITIEKNFESVEESSLDLDSEGNAHIAYYYRGRTSSNDLIQELKYAKITFND